jgi:hypothetical protein
MNLKPNHWCRICDKQFWACDSCDKKLGIFWRQTACSEKHGTLYSILIDYRDGQISKDEAKKQVLATGVTKDEINTFIPQIKDKINNILSVPIEDKVETPNNNSVDDAESSIPEMNETIETPVVKRGRKPKVTESNNESEEAE